MINYQGVVDKYIREPYTAHENAKRQGIYSNSKYVCCLLLLLTLLSYPDHRLFALSAEANMIDLCEIPEDISAFKTLIRDKVGQEISGSEIELLKKEMEITQDRETIDYGYSRSEKIRYVFLRKECIAQDKVSYTFNLGVITDLRGNAIFHQAFILYQKEDILNGKRKFSFENVATAKKDYSALVSKDTVGMNRAQLEEHMDSLDCSKIETDKKDFAEFLCQTELEKGLAARIVGYVSSKSIYVDFSSEGIVEKVRVSF